MRERTIAREEDGEFVNCVFERLSSPAEGPDYVNSNLGQFKMLLTKWRQCVNPSLRVGRRIEGHRFHLGRFLVVNWALSKTKILENIFGVYGDSFLRSFSADDSFNTGSGTEPTPREFKVPFGSYGCANSELM
jgi:hypothetical protein